MFPQERAQQRKLMSSSQLLAMGGDAQKIPGNFSIVCDQCGAEQKNRAFCYFCGAVGAPSEKGRGLVYMCMCMFADPCRSNLTICVPSPDAEEPDLRALRAAEVSGDWGGLPHPPPGADRHRSALRGRRLRLLRELRVSLAPLHSGARLRLRVAGRRVRGSGARRLLRVPARRLVPRRPSLHVYHLR